MKLELDNCTVDIDAEATRAYYKSNPEPYSCDCENCRAYINRAPDFPEKVREYFASCGIDDMLYAVEVTTLYEDVDGVLHLFATFHAVGTMEGGAPGTHWYPPAYRRRRFFARIFNKKLYEEIIELERLSDLERWSDPKYIDEDFSVVFSNRKDLIPKGFPENSLQIDLYTNIKTHG